MSRSKLRSFGENENRSRDEDPEKCNAVDVHIGSRVQRTRLFRGLVLVEFARAIGVSEAEARAHESGQSRIDARTLQRMAQVLNIEPSFFLQKLPRRLSDIAQNGEREKVAEKLVFSAPAATQERVRQLIASNRDPATRSVLGELLLLLTNHERVGSWIM